MADADSHLPPITFTWERVQRTALKMGHQIATEGVPDIVVAIQRGGLIPSVIVSHLLDIRSLITLDVRRTVREGLDSPKIPPVFANKIPVEDLCNKDVLVVDDIAGSGLTLDCTVGKISECKPLRIRTMVCVVNRAQWDATGKREPEEIITYIGEEVRGWVIFPWECSRT